MVGKETFLSVIEREVRDIHCGMTLGAFQVESFRQRIESQRAGAKMNFPNVAISIVDTVR